MYLWFHLFHDHLLSLSIRNIGIALLHWRIVTKLIWINIILLMPLTWRRACSTPETIILRSCQIRIRSLIIVYISPCCCILNLCTKPLVHITDSLRIHRQHYFCCIIRTELLLMLFYLNVFIILNHLIHSVNFIL